MGIRHSFLRNSYLHTNKDENESEVLPDLPTPGVQGTYPLIHGQCSSVSSENEGLCEERVTPKHVMSIIDPRSPNGEISRTPIVIAEENSTGSSRLGRKLSRPNQTGKNGAENSTPTGGKIFPLFDPRSPSEEIKRTPIAVDGKLILREKGHGDTPCPPNAGYMFLKTRKW